MTIRLILARHGNTFESGQMPIQVGAKTDPPLTAQGRTQAEDLGDYFRSKGIVPSEIYAGTLKRQIESAQIIAQALNSQNKLNLNESTLTEIDYGAWEGLTSDEIAFRWPEEYSNWIESGKWPEQIFNGKLENHIANINQWLDLLRNTQAAGSTVIAVSSNGLIRFFSDEWQRLGANGQMDSLKIKTGHFCELELTPNSLRVIRWNSKPMVLKKV